MNPLILSGKGAQIVAIRDGEAGYGPCAGSTAGLGNKQAVLKLVAGGARAPVAAAGCVNYLSRFDRSLHTRVHDLFTRIG